MSIEHYAVFRAALGSLCDRIAHEIMDARRAAGAARSEFSKSVGGVGLWCHDHQVSGVIFPSGSKLPVGWLHHLDVATGIVALPDKRKRHGKNLAVALRALPKLPSFEVFTARIGGDHKIVGRALRHCHFERVGDELFVMTPFFRKDDEHGVPDEQAPADQFFTPEGCERVPLSVYFAAKEAAEASAKGAVAA